MDFLKKFFGGKKEETSAKTAQDVGKTFVCENCGQTRPVSKKKAHDDEHAVQGGEKPKNVCEFC